MLSSVYLVEYTLHQNLMTEIYTRNFDLHITVPSPNLAFLCRNLDCPNQSINLPHFFPLPSPLLSNNSFLSYPSVPFYTSFHCLPPSLHLLLLLLPLLLFLPLLHFPLSLPHPLPSLSLLPPSLFHSSIILFAFLSPPSFALLHSLSPYLPLSPSLPLTLQNVIFLSPLVPSLSSSFLFSSTPSLSPSLLSLSFLLPSLPSLCSIHNTVIYNST